MFFSKTSLSLLLGAILALPSCSSDPEQARLSSEARALDGQAQGLYKASYAAEKAGEISSAVKGYEKINRLYPMSPYRSRVTIPRLPSPAKRWGTPQGVRVIRQLTSKTIPPLPTTPTR